MVLLILSDPLIYNMEEVRFLTFAHYIQECDHGLLEIWIRAIKERTWAVAHNHSYLEVQFIPPCFHIWQWLDHDLGGGVIEGNGLESSSSCGVLVSHESPLSTWDRTGHCVSPSKGYAMRPMTIWDAATRDLCCHWHRCISFSILNWVLYGKSFGISGF